MHPVHFGPQLNARRPPLPYFCKVSGFAGWQASFIEQQLPAGQLAHPQPQADFPFLLPRAIPAMTAATTRSRTALMMIVAIFPISHVNMQIPPTIISFIGQGASLLPRPCGEAAYSPADLRIFPGSPNTNGLPGLFYYEFTIFTFFVSFVASL